jgi:hypothetical protein
MRVKMSPKRSKIAIAAIGVVFLAWLTLRVPYHKWRLEVSARATRDARLNAPRQSKLPRFIQGDRKTYQEYETDVRYHEAALLRLGYFGRREFGVTNSIDTTLLQGRFRGLAAKRFPDHLWDVTVTNDGRTVIVTTRRQLLHQWEELVREFDAGMRRND